MSQDLRGCTSNTKRIEPTTYSIHEDSILSIAFSPDGTRFASSSLDQTIKLFEVSGVKIKPIGLINLSQTLHGPLALSFSRNNKFLLSAGFGLSRAYLWDISNPANPALMHQMGDDPGFVWDMKVTWAPFKESQAHEFSEMVYVSDCGTIQVYDVSKGIALWSCRLGCPLNSLVILPECLQAVVAEKSGYLTTVDLKRRHKVCRSRVDEHVNTIAKHQLIVAQSSNQHYYVSLFFKEKKIRRLQCPMRHEVQSLAFSQDGRWLVVGEGHSERHTVFNTASAAQAFNFAPNYLGRKKRQTFSCAWGNGVLATTESIGVIQMCII